MGHKVGEGVIGRCRNRHRPLLATSLQADDDVLLQNLVVLEGLAARLEQVHMADGGTLKDEVAERPIVRPIAEATRDDGHDLPARCCLSNSQRNEGTIQVHRLDADTAQGQPVRGIAVDLLVRRVEDGVGVPWK
ncbi:MAG: hypothetical protein DDT34_02130 [Firmicutes bacterium]|nr:hypothetical protein [Bacillota bacterium]